jgi:hypothetical protein
MRLLTRKGCLIEEQWKTYLTDTDPDTALGPLQSAACTYRIALGPRAGQKVLTLQTVSTPAPSTPERCVNAQGFSLHAEVRCAINQRHQLEHLCRYAPVLTYKPGWPYIASVSWIPAIPARMTGFFIRREMDRWLALTNRYLNFTRSLTRSWRKA